MAISMLKIRRPLGRLIFNMGITIPCKTVFLIETAPRPHETCSYQEYGVIEYKSSVMSYNGFCGCTVIPWWRHQMETFSALLAFWAGIHRSPVNSPHKGQRRGALMFLLICSWINASVNNCEAGNVCQLRHMDLGKQVTSVYVYQN